METLNTIDLMPLLPELMLVGGAMILLMIGAYSSRDTMGLVTGGAVALLIAVLAVPTKVICPNGPCTTAPDAQGNVHRYYEMKPLGAALVEEVTGLRIPIRYTSGVDSESLK